MKQVVLVLIDIQREYVTPDRPFYLKGIEPSLTRCAALLEAARDAGAKIIHVQHLKAGAPIFSADSAFSDFVPGFEPEVGEEHIKKSLYSCYTHPSFLELMEAHENDLVYVAGYNTIMCCLSTLIDAYHRGHHLNLIQDASYAKSTERYDELDMHEHALSLIETAGYGSLMSTEDALDQLAQFQRARADLVSA